MYQSIKFYIDKRNDQKIELRVESTFEDSIIHHEYIFFEFSKPNFVSDESLIASMIGMTLNAFKYIYRFTNTRKLLFAPQETIKIRITF